MTEPYIPNLGGAHPDYVPPTHVFSGGVSSENLPPSHQLQIYLSTTGDIVIRNREGDGFHAVRIPPRIVGTVIEALQALQIGALAIETVVDSYIPQVDA